MPSFIFHDKVLKVTSTLLKPSSKYGMALGRGFQMNAKITKLWMPKPELSGEEPGLDERSEDLW